MSERIQQLKEKLLNSRRFWDAVIEQVGDRGDTQVYSDGLQWNVRQIVAHVADADLGHNRQVMGIAEDQEVISADFDLERYNKRVTEKTAEKTIEQAQAELKKQREDLHAWLDTLDEAKLDKIGRHATLKMMPVERILQILSRHEQEHATDIARTLNINVE